MSLVWNKVGCRSERREEEAGNGIREWNAWEQEEGVGALWRTTDLNCSRMPDTRSAGRRSGSAFSTKKHARTTPAWKAAVSEYRAGVGATANKGMAKDVVGMAGCSRACASVGAHEERR